MEWYPVESKVADHGGTAQSAIMNRAMSERSVRLWATGLCAFYAVMFVPGSFLAYIGMMWVDDSGRGWRTPIAAGALMVAWFPLALGCAFAGRAIRTRSGVDLRAGVAFGLIAMAFYAVFLAWGGPILI